MSLLWIIFLNLHGLFFQKKKEKEVFVIAKKLFKRLQIKKVHSISRICGDHSKEYKNTNFFFFCNEQDIRPGFSTHNTLQQNGVVKRKNRVVTY